MKENPGRLIEGEDFIPHNSAKTSQQIEEEARRREEILAQWQTREPHVCSGSDCALSWENEILS